MSGVDVGKAADEKHDATNVLLNAIEGLAFEETASVNTHGALAKSDSVTVGNTGEIRYENVWQKMDGKARIGAKKLWDDTFGDAMPCKVKNERLGALCVVAFSGDEVVAVSTVVIEMNSSLYCKVGWLRCLVKEEFRRRGIFTEIMSRCKIALEEWAIENPLAGLLAMGVMLELKFDGKNLNNKDPVWPKTGLTLVGYTQRGVQIRIAWLKQARVEF
ncbi:unnamed protein product [Pseudo-nitzschia multistriata]|uniref:N-acetyltransferase domain-containing protein n=1 Tax=Pseudo-nitzschia multistriata TaxID=183589 RepID=A0A448Z465_9STRA|nr:unnamed protein product [Pseudo-nitzschia multistriata]